MWEQFRDLWMKSLYFRISVAVFVTGCYVNLK